MQDDQRPSLSRDRAEDAAAIATLVSLGLIDVLAKADGKPTYRLTKALFADEFTPNAALRDRLCERRSVASRDANDSKRRCG